MEPQMWQNPFVNIFKNVRIGHDNNDNKKIKKEGEVKYTLDETVRFWALKLKGHVSAKNTATIPPSRKESLDLHGRFMYVQLRAEPPKIFVLHILDLFLQSVHDETNMFKFCFNLYTLT